MIDVRREEAIGSGKELTQNQPSGISSIRGIQTLYIFRGV